MSSSLRLGFSTLGSPGASFAEVCALAERHGLAFLELRALGGSLDLPAYFLDHPVVESTVEVRVLGSSLSLFNATPEALAEFYRLAALAHRLGTPYLRVFADAGGRFTPETEPKEATLAAAAEVVRTVRAHLKEQGWKAELLLETHDVLSSAERCLALNRHLDEPLALIWDSYHTWEATGEPLAVTWRKLGSLVRHVHYKDGVPVPEESRGHRYVLPGEGTFPAAELRALLTEAGYAGGLSLEWERLWHPALSPIEEALPPFCRLFA